MESGDVPEALSRGPGLAGGADLAHIPRHEVPPHEDAFLEGRAAEQQDAGAPGAAEFDRRASGRRGVKNVLRECHALERDVAIEDEEAVLEARIQRDLDRGPGVDHDIRAQQFGEVPRGRSGAEARSRKHAHPAALDFDEGRLWNMLKFRRSVAIGLWQCHPKLHAVQTARVRRRRLLRVRDPHA